MGQCHRNLCPCKNTHHKNKYLHLDSNPTTTLTRASLASMLIPKPTTTTLTTTAIIAARTSTSLTHIDQIEGKVTDVFVDHHLAFMSENHALYADKCLDQKH